MQRLDDLLCRIVEEPLRNTLSRNEIEFWEKMKIVKHFNRGEYARYLLIYQEVQASKYEE